MNYLSVCSGIEAATVAWKPLGWKPVAFSEIDDFPSAVLSWHYPNIPNWGDMNLFERWPDVEIDLLCGGTPCQSFSIAGLRKGLDDPRGNLTLTFVRIAKRYKPRWVLWENVPGVLSSNGGRDFGTFLGGLAEIGYGFAYRVFDAQYFGVPQQRRRVFVVGHIGDWRPAAAVLFEPNSMQGDFTPRRKTQKEITESLVSSVARCITAGEMKRQDYETCTFIPDVTIFHPTQDPISSTNDITHTLTTGGSSGACTVAVSSKTTGVRRLTPRECERLQGFPDDYTRIPWRGKPAEQCPDGPRYKALGNSWAVPVVQWIGKRIDFVDSLR